MVVCIHYLLSSVHVRTCSGAVSGLVCPPYTSVCNLYQHLTTITNLPNQGSSNRKTGWWRLVARARLMTSVPAAFNPSLNKEAMIE